MTCIFDNPSQVQCRRKTTFARATVARDEGASLPVPSPSSGDSEGVCGGAVLSSWRSHTWSWVHSEGIVLGSYDDRVDNRQAGFRKGHPIP